MNTSEIFNITENDNYFNINRIHKINNVTETASIIKESLCVPCLSSENLIKLDLIKDETRNTLILPVYGTGIDIDNTPYFSEKYKYNEIEPPLKRILNEELNFNIDHVDNSIIMDCVEYSMHYEYIIENKKYEDNYIFLNINNLLVHGNIITLLDYQESGKQNYSNNDNMFCKLFVYIYGDLELIQNKFTNKLISDEIQAIDLIPITKVKELFIHNIQNINKNVYNHKNCSHFLYNDGINHYSNRIKHTSIQSK